MYDMIICIFFKKCINCIDISTVYSLEFTVTLFPLAKSMAGYLMLCQALAAAFNNPERAVDYLFNGCLTEAAKEFTFLGPGSRPKTSTRGKHDETPTKSSTYRPTIDLGTPKDLLFLEGLNQNRFSTDMNHQIRYLLEAL